MTQPEPGNPRKNTRRSRRRPPKGGTRVSVYGNALGLGKNIACGLLDMSEAGVRLLLSQAVPVGKEIEVTFESAGGRSARIVATIIWIVEAADGRFCVGAQFSKELSYHLLEALARP